MPWRGPEYEGELPTLGWTVIDWIESMLIVPDGPTAGDPLELTAEQAQFILNFYAIDPSFLGPAVRGRALRNGRRVRRAVLSRPKGWGKSPFIAALCLAEALAPVVPDGWDANGEPVGRPWTTLGFKAKVQIVAVSEGQTINTWDPLLEMARSGPIAEAYPIEAMDSFVALPRGRIEYTTSAGVSREGFRPVFYAMDQTESWVRSNGGLNLAERLRRNLAKVNGSSVETPNAFVPGDESVAEKSHDAAVAQAEGRLRGDAGGILYDHRQALDDTDATDETSLRAGLRVAYGDSIDTNGGWVSEDRIVQDYWDPGSTPSESRRYYLNQHYAAEDAWIADTEWRARADVDRIVERGEMITLGFDGSRERARGVTDATALIACTVADGHVFEPLEQSIWEQPADWPKQKPWRVPVGEIDRAVHEIFRRYNVVGFFADPAKWETYVAAWEAKYGDRLKVKASRDHPIEWWMTGGRSHLIVAALREFYDAVIDGDQFTHDGRHGLSRHVLNARLMPTRAGLQIRKEHPDSPKKIDGAVAAMLARKARREAIAKGFGVPNRSTFIPRRIR